MNIGKEIFRLVNLYIELRITSLMFLILFRVREFREKSQVVHILLLRHRSKPFRAILPAIFRLFAKTSMPIVTNVSSAF